jgi:hypothetical protein
MARRSKQTRAEIERQLLREIMALDEPYINLTDRKVPFDADMCQRIEDNEVLEYGEDGLEVPRGYIVLTTGRDLFMDFIRFYDHDVPRTFGFDRDPRRAYAEKYGGKDLYKLSGRDKLNRRQWDMLERYEASEGAPRLLDDYKDEQGELRSGLISVVADKLQQTAAQADPARRRKPNVRKEAQRKIREISKIFGGLDLGSLEKEHIRQARKYVLASKNGVYLVPSARLFALVGVPLTREATRVERIDIATTLATDELNKVVYGEDGEDMDPQAFWMTPFCPPRGCDVWRRRSGSTTGRRSAWRANGRSSICAVGKYGSSTNWQKSSAFIKPQTPACWPSGSGTLTPNPSPTRARTRRCWHSACTAQRSRTRRQKSSCSPKPHSYSLIHFAIM